jgi:2-polyprenyl-3-methyl-5-hydroxy-6-metoxy-1,4-benzoquinol methylase
MTGRFAGRRLRSPAERRCVSNEREEATMAVQQVDGAKAEAFAGQMLATLNGGFLAVLVSLGYRSGLFETMAELGRPSTSKQIADAAALDERYVREWLGGLATGKIVEYDATEETYGLPPEHAAFLTRAAGPDNLAFFGQYVSLCGSLEDEILGCFATGAGLPYSAYPRFQELQGEESARTFDTALVDKILPLAEGLVERLEQGIEVLDIGCGTGHAINLMAKAFPASRFTGYDFSEEGIGHARAEACELGLANARFEVRDAEKLDAHETYGLVTAFDVVHDLARPRAVLERVRAALRPDGSFLMVEIAAASELEDNLDHPLGPTLYAASLFHCMSVSLSQGGEGLGTMWGERRARELLDELGFDATVGRLDGDILHSYFVARRR